MNTVCQQHSICQLCEEGKAKYVIRNIHNNNRLSICVDCQKEFNFKGLPSEEVKT